MLVYFCFVSYFLRVSVFVRAIKRKKAQNATSEQYKYGGPTKPVKALPHIRTKTSLLGPFKKLNCLNDTKTSFLGPFKLFIFLQKDFARTKSTKSIKTTKQKHKTQISE